MDLGLFRDEERFPTFDSLGDDYTDNSRSQDGIHNSDSFWEHDTELEINGDLALIPMSSSLYQSLNLLSGSPNLKEDINKIMNDWQQIMNIENVEEFVLENAICEAVQGEEEIMHQHNIDMLNITQPSTFDIAAYMDEPGMSPAKIFEAEPNVTQKKPGIGMKKIDLKAQRYIVDEDNDGEDDVDVETVSECENSPVLEAGDLNSLLEQFEATELPDISTNLLDTSISSLVLSIADDKLDKDLKKEEYIVGRIDPDEFLQDDPISEKGEECSGDIDPYGFLQGDHKSEKKEDIDKKQEPPVKPDPPKPETTPNKNSTTSTSTETSQNNAIINQLPKELIDRIKESGKRKPISVIPPMPNRKRGATRVAQDSGVKDRGAKIGDKQRDAVQLDHDYCSVQTGYSKNPKKDSGFESSEEDDRVNIKHQPIVKNTDGTLMVSLLKVNTIHDASKKRKLNLEEYKKRRVGVWRSKNADSPLSSTCNSPTPEDENVKRIKHQEKLMRMAKEVLSTAPKSETNSSANVIAPEPVQKVILPPDMVKKTVVSIGVNTDFVTIDKEFKKGKNDPLAPVQQLEEIKPLLEKASGQINRNSLITSVIENIPKVITNSKTTTDASNKCQDRLSEHGEDKTILYLPKDRTSVTTTSIAVQTNISLLTVNKQGRYRRRNSSASSSSSDSSVERNSYGRKRKVSTSSTYSNTSRSSSSSYSYSSSSSRSRSRSLSPRTRRKARKVDDQLRKEVEERRVIYVGRISSSVVKEDLRKRFGKFGPITNISLHFRDHGDNYGFVTFANKYDAYEAIEHGNDDPYLAKYDLSFGGRRIFCQTTYSDLDNMRDDSYLTPRLADNSFDVLLKQAQEKLRKRKV